MRRRTAGLLVTGAVLLVGGYVAWCGRTFYLEARLLESWKLPPEVVAMLPPLLETEGLTVPEEFGMHQLADHLCRPYQSPGAAEIRVEQWPPDVIVLLRGNGCIVSAAVHFIRKDGVWRHVTVEEFYSEQR